MVTAVGTRAREETRLLVCAPSHFDSHFLFNPAMAYTDRVDRRLARKQWRRLVGVLEEAGAQLDRLDPDPGTSTLPFTADGAFVYAPGLALVLRNDGARGVFEPDLFARWLVAHGYQVESLPPGRRLDGGNLLRLEDGTVLAGIKPGGDGRAERYLTGLLRLHGGARVHTVPLVDERFLHLDLAVGALGGGRFLVHREALAGGRLPPALGEVEVVDVSAADAARYACNVVVVGDVVVTGPVSDGLVRRLTGLGFTVERVDLSEFYKAGGGSKCLTLPLWPG
jgi:N-dimethylarginine dimethylaminohydrolase